MTSRAVFKQNDVVRAVKGVTAAGLNIARVEFNGSEIIVVVGDASTKGRCRPNPVDKLYGPEA